MPLPALAPIDDLEEWLGVEVVSARAGAILAAASTLVRTTTGRVWVDADGELEEGLTEDDLKLQAVREVVVMVATRVYTNPGGVQQQTSGPYSETVAAWASLGMALTETELGMIASPAGGIPGLSSVRVIAPADANPTRRWWPECDESDENDEEIGS